jgi:hypothetical protein
VWREFEHPWSDGTTCLLFEAEEFLEKLAALTSRPEINLVHVAQTGHILRVKNRPGNVHDSKQSVAFLREVITGLRAGLLPKVLDRWRREF